MFNLPGKKKRSSKSSQVGDISAAPQESVEGQTGTEAAEQAGQAGLEAAGQAAEASPAEAPNPNQELIERWDHRADLPIDEFAKSKIAVTNKELVEERDAVKSMLPK